MNLTVPDFVLRDKIRNGKPGLEVASYSGHVGGGGLGTRLGWRLSLANQTKTLSFLLMWAGLARLVAMLVGTKSGIIWSRAQLAEPESKLKFTPN